MKKIIIVTVMLILGVLCLKGQYPKIELYNNDITEFPTITTAFRLFDANGDEIRNSGSLYPLSNSDFIIEEIEKGIAIQRQVEYIHCPTADQTRLSIIFVCDISTSMATEIESGTRRIDILKEVLLDVVKDIDPKRTEVAITLFAGDAIGHPSDINNKPFQPFTSDKVELTASVNSIENMYAGTNWNAAFLYKNGKTYKQDLSALYYCQDTVRKYKPVIIFLTDGDHLVKGQVTEFRLAEVKQIAEERNASIYCIQVSDVPFEHEQNKLFFMKLAEIGKRLGDNTPNYWLQAYDSSSLGGIYQTIIEEASAFADPPPCYVTWKTACEGGSATFTMPNHGMVSDITEYTFDYTKVPELRIIPTPVYFQNIAPGSTIEQTLTLTALNNQVEINDFSLLEGKRAEGKYVISDWGIRKPLPITIEKDEAYQITLQYIPSDSLFSECKMNFESNACNSATISISAEMQPFIQNLNFGDVLAGTTKDSIFTHVFCNNTGRKITITNISIDGPDKSAFMFNNVHYPVTLDSGECIDFSISCSPEDTPLGARIAQLTLLTDYNSMLFEGTITCNVVQGTSVFDDNLEQNIIKLYPNPASNEVSIVFNDYFSRDNMFGSAEIIIYNSMGIEVQTIKIDDIGNMDKFNINIEDIQSGIYFVGIKSNNLNELIPLSIIK
jgi:uncharacterized protein YegL